MTSWMSFFLWFDWPESPPSTTTYSFFFLIARKGPSKIFQVPILLNPMFTSWGSWSLLSWSSCLNVEAKLKFWGKCDTIEDHLETWLLNKTTVEVSATGLWLLQTQSFYQVYSPRHWLPSVKIHKTNLEVVGYSMTTMPLFQQWKHLVQ